MKTNSTVARIGRLVARLFRRLIPGSYRGRLDRLSPDDQQKVIGSNFRGGM